MKLFVAAFFFSALSVFCASTSSNNDSLTKQGDLLTIEKDGVHISDEPEVEQKELNKPSKTKTSKNKKLSAKNRTKRKQEKKHHRTKLVDKEEAKIIDLGSETEQKQQEQTPKPQQKTPELTLSILNLTLDKTSQSQQEQPLPSQGAYQGWIDSDDEEIEVEETRNVLVDGKLITQTQTVRCKRYPRKPISDEKKKALDQLAVNIMLAISPNLVGVTHGENGAYSIDIEVVRRDELSNTATSDQSYAEIANSPNQISEWY